MNVVQAVSEAREWERFVSHEQWNKRATEQDYRDARTALAQAQIAFYAAMGRFDHAEEVRAREERDAAYDDETDLVNEIVGAIGAALRANPERVAAGDTLEVHLDR